MLAVLLLLASAAVANNDQLLTDITQIQNYWGQIRPYQDNPPWYFSVQDTGLPDGCQVEQVHVLHRHGARYPTGSDEDGPNNERLAAKVKNYTLAHPGKTSFTGPLSFLNTYSYQLGESLLVASGAAMEYKSGVDFWNQYGRILYNASVGQTYYNGTFPNGTARPLPVLRTTSQARIHDSAVDWAQGFFGPYNTTTKYTLVIMPEGGTENNTLASYDGCANDNIESIGYIGDADVFSYIPLYLGGATSRLSQYVDSAFNLTDLDVYAMQSSCAYEYNALGSSDFCYLFTLAEWEGFEYTLDLEYAYDYSYQNPTGRAQGIGYVQELFARLNNQLITVGNTSVNVTFDNNAADFPLGQKFYLDMSHDDILVSVVTALSIDYFKEDLPIDAVPPPADRHFVLSHLTPFGTRLNTEVIGCASANPTAKQNATTVYTPTANGYNPSNATNKFIRMRWNNGVLPLSTIRGGLCAGRSDGLCPLDKFKASQVNATALASYQFSCFGNYTLKDFKGDGAVYPSDVSK